ncbi:MAG: flagellar biosynthesis protein FlaG [Thermoproteus sp.]|jgi:FlaG/FlaF family flagellin (archaellin)|nr:flagellar biosynthesis protein FlaG [Thermoproteus sp.]MDT7882055.1 flagellar biosynthesis protein FlaG [Thermoproteus sp.]
MRKVKGIEPIVAAVLLIVLAVVGAVLLYLWFAGYVTKATSQAEQISATERLSIEAANLSSSTDVSYLYVRNLGGSNVTLATAYLLKPGTVSPLCATSAITVYRGLSTTSGTVSTLYPGQDQLVQISFGTSCTITSGYSYVIKIVTQQGTQFAVTVTAS